MPDIPRKIGDIHANVNENTLQTGDISPIWRWCIFWGIKAPGAKNASLSRSQESSMTPKEKTVLQMRIEGRLGDLNLSMRGAALASGLEETFVKNILHGKSKNPRISGLQALANTLKCDVDWLTGESNRLHQGRRSAILAGTIAEGVFRKPPKSDKRKSIPVAQVEWEGPILAYELEGDLSSEIGARGSFLICDPYLDQGLTPGIVVVVQKKIEGEELVENRVRRVLVIGNDVFLAQDRGGNDPEKLSSNERIAAIAHFAIADFSSKSSDQ